MTIRPMHEGDLSDPHRTCVRQSARYGIISEVAGISGGRVLLRAGTLYTALDRLRQFSQPPTPMFPPRKASQAYRNASRQASSRLHQAPRRKSILFAVVTSGQKAGRILEAP